MARRGGVTLLELLLVLGLLVILASLALPALHGPLENHQLRKSADLVRAEWNRGRFKAMETGRTFVFRYQPQSRQYHLEPWTSPDDYLEAALSEAAEVGSSTATLSLSQATGSTANVRLRELPENISFVGGETNVDLRAALTSQYGNQQEKQETADAAPIYFYPDGTSSTATIWLANRRGRYVRLQLRGLTGVVQVSDLTGEAPIQ